MLRFHNLSVQLEGRQILEDISFSLRPHRLTALVGSNGSGKSTLLSCVNGQIPYTGSIFLNEQDVSRLSPRERAKSLALLPQSLPEPHITVAEQTAFGRVPYLDFTGRLSSSDKACIAQAQQDAGVLNLSNRYVDSLSGGERQRAALAMVLAQDTPIALLDEPAAHMDLPQGTAFLQLLHTLKETRGKTFLVVLHDLTQAARFADDILVLDRGKLVFCGTTRTCLDNQVLERTFSLHRHTVSENDNDRIFFSAD